MLAEKPLAVDFIEEHPLAAILPRPPILSSKKAGWDGIVLEYHSQPAHETPEHCFAQQHIVSIALGQPFKSERVLNGRLVSDRMGDGDIFIAPVNTYHQSRCDREAEFIVLSLEPALVTRAASDLVELDHLEIVPHFTIADPLVQQIGLALKAELKSDGLNSRLYVDSLVTALCIHLIRRYSASGQKIPTHSGGLQQKLRWAIEYINENLEQDLTLSEIAATVGMSPYHFAREFKELTGLPPHRYLVERRLEKAKKLLAETDLAIAQIAYHVGFANQSHFTTVFRKYAAITPKAYRDAL